MTWLVLGLALLIGLALMMRWFVTAEPKAIIRALKWGGAILFVLISGFLLLTGKLGWIFMALPALLPWFMRARALANGARAFRRMSSGNQGAPRESDVETDYLRMKLDHGSGRMSGEVLRGEFQGQHLADLSVSELARLWQFLETVDPPSARLVETFLDRSQPGWRDQADSESASEGASSGNRNAKMTREEALEILGVSADAEPKTIREAYHRLINSLHPDKGGSTYLAAKINEARDVLLGS